MLNRACIFNKVSVVATAFALVVLFGGGCDSNPGGSNGNGNTAAGNNKCGVDGTAGSCKAVKIGNQTWLAENLNRKIGNSACYANKEANCKKYGRLYDRETALTACPSGWHLPTLTEWEELVSFVDKTWKGNNTDAGMKLKSKNGWTMAGSDIPGNGTDNYGFAALPGGVATDLPTFFLSAGSVGKWWMATKEDEDERGFGMSGGGSNVSFGSVGCCGVGLSVRCLQVSIPDIVYGTPLTYESQTYKTVKIGNQTWMAENLNYRTDDSWCYDNADTNCVKYGRLYTWKAAQEVCPSGWRLPDTADWNVLRMTTGARFMGRKLKAKDGWDWYDRIDVSGNGTDEYGFSALPGGERYSNGSFQNVGKDGRWWTPIEYICSGCGEFAYSWYMNGSVGAGSPLYVDKNNGCSVRCIMGGTLVQ